MIKSYIERISEGNNLQLADAYMVMQHIMHGECNNSQISGLLLALRTKGETPEEVAGFVKAMRDKSLKITSRHKNTIDVCGTGGDGSNTFNISTTAALVVAGAGAPVAKHGNRAITSKCGSADLLAELGVNIEALPEVVENCVREAGIGFLFAPKLHPAMKHAMGPRKELGVRTIFNMLGPLTNPAGAKGQIIGVFSSELTETFANVLKILGSRRAFIVRGHDGLDEITTTTMTRISELSEGRVRTYDFDPIQYIGEYSSSLDFAGGDPATNAEITRKILAGEKGPRRDIVCINAAAAIVAGGKAHDIKQGWEMAQQSIDNGSAGKSLEMLIKISRES